MTRFRDDARETAVMIALSAMVIIAIVVGVAALWGARVGMSGVQGQGDAIIEKNSAGNWTTQQADFQRRYYGLQAQHDKITLMKKTAKAVGPTHTELLGAQQVCLSLVGEYNAKANEYLAQQFRDATLPSSVSAATYCD